MSASISPAAWRDTYKSYCEDNGCVYDPEQADYAYHKHVEQTKYHNTPSGETRKPVEMMEIRNPPPKESTTFSGAFKHFFGILHLKELRDELIKLTPRDKLEFREMLIREGYDIREGSFPILPPTHADGAPMLPAYIPPSANIIQIDSPSKKIDEPKPEITVGSYLWSGESHPTAQST